MGNCHTVECWHEGELVGGLYGVALGGAFFGESMFSRTRDASKVALVHLAARLVAGGFRRSEEHTSELQSLMRISYAVFCLKKKKTHTKSITRIYSTHDALDTQHDLNQRMCTR